MRPHFYENFLLIETSPKIEKEKEKGGKIGTLPKQYFLLDYFQLLHIFTIPKICLEIAGLGLLSLPKTNKSSSCFYNFLKISYAYFSVWLGTNLTIYLSKFCK